MNFTTPKLNQSSGLAIPLALIVLGLFVGYLLYRQGLVVSAPPPAAPSVRANDNLAKFKNKNDFDFKFFDDPAFKSLKLLGDVPVQPGPHGKTDLFAPF